MDLKTLAQKSEPLAKTLEELKQSADTSQSKVYVLKHMEPTSFESTVYTPFLCLIVRGKKEMLVGGSSIFLDPGQSLVLCHDLPVVARITQASQDQPYLALVMQIEMNLIRSLYNEIGEADANDRPMRPLALANANGPLLDALGRYLDLAGKPEDAAVLGPMIIREIHFRLLTAPNGGMLRQMLTRDSHASRISRAIDIIRQDYKSSLTVTDLSKAASMSASSFHEHFKTVTGTTPLQYQKDLRLIEAKTRLANGRHSVSTIAFDVGYESASQFSREFTRKFGAPPSEAVGKPLVAI